MGISMALLCDRDVEGHIHSGHDAIASGNTVTMSYIGTRHQERRLRQRGVDNETFAMIVEWADREVPVGGGAVSLTMSRGAINEMAVEGVRVPSCDKLSRLAVVVSSDGTVKTVLVMRKSGRSARRYRRQ